MFLYALLFFFFFDIILPLILVTLPITAKFEQIQHGLPMSQSVGDDFLLIFFVQLLGNCFSLDKIFLPRILLTYAHVSLTHLYVALFCFAYLLFLWLTNFTTFSMKNW